MTAIVVVAMLSCFDGHEDRENGGCGGEFHFAGGWLSIKQTVLSMYKMVKRGNECGWSMRRYTDIDTDIQGMTELRWFEGDTTNDLDDDNVTKD